MIGLIYLKRKNLAYCAAWIISGITFINSIQATEIAGQEIGITLDFTYASKYMWHGYDTYNDHGAFQPSITLDYAGFYAGLWASWADSSGYDDLTETDIYLGYEHSFLSEERYAIDTDVSYTYFAYPKIDSSGDVQEFAFSMSFPNILPLGPSSLIPGYTLFYDFDGVQSKSAIDAGWFHQFSLSYAIPIPALLTEQEEQDITLLSDVTYGDGAFGANSGWSHAALGISTTFEWQNFYLTPALNYQFSFEDSVNDEDDFYATFGIGYSF